MKKTIHNTLFIITSLFFISGCATTTFSGKPHMTPPECELQCRDWGMQLDGMVAMGEYSSACICKKNKSSRKQSSTRELTGQEGSVAAVETILRMMRQNAAAAQQRM